MITIIKFLDMPLSTIDKWIKQAERDGEKVMVSINTYDLWNGELKGGYSQQIRSSKDLFQYDDKDKDDDDENQ
jgi:hypothetical protein